MKLFQNRKLRTPLLTAVSVCLLVAVCASSLLLASLLRKGGLFADLTYEGLYTMSDAMTDELSNVKEDVTVTFCEDADRLLADTKLSCVYLLACELSAAMPNIHVETLSLVRDSHAADRYKMTAASQIGADNVIVSYGSKFRIADADAFYTVDSTGNPWSYKGEYQLASMILSVTGVPTPCAYFTVGHGEKVFDPDDPDAEASRDLLSFSYLLADAGLRVDTLDLDTLGTTGEIPEDCVLLIMNAPTSDYADSDIGSLYYRSSLEKIDRYLEKRGNFFYFQDSATSPSALPVLCEYLAEWGIAFGDGILKDARVGDLVESERTNVTAVYAAEDTSAIAHSLYAAIADLAAAPRTVLPNVTPMRSSLVDRSERMLADGVTRTVAPILFSSASTRAYDRVTGDLLSDSGNYPLGMVGVTAYFADDATYSYSYLVAFGTDEVLSERYLGSNAFGNKDILSAALRTVTRTDIYASSDLGSSTDLNSKNYGGKIFVSDAMVTEKTYLFRRGEEELITTTNIGNKSGYRLVRTMVPLTAGNKVWLAFLLFVFPVVVIPAAAFTVLRRRKNR